MSLVDVLSGDAANATTVQQVVDSMKGTAGKGQPIAFTALSDSVNFALTVKNLDAVNSRGLQVIRANGNVLLQADATGVIVSPDGTASTAQIVNLSLAQTLTNKTLTSPTLTTPTLTSPTMTTAVVSSGGLTITAGGEIITAGGLQVTAGNAGIGGAPVAAQGLTISAGQSGTNAYGARVTSLLTASAGSATLAAISLDGTFNANAQASVLEAQLSVPTYNASGAANAYGVKVAAPTGAATDNLAILATGKSAYQGSTSDNTASALLVQNSTPTTLFNVRNDGMITIANSAGQLGFYGAAGATKQAIAGSRAGNAALANLLSALATYGLVTDSTTA